MICFLSLISLTITAMIWFAIKREFLFVLLSAVMFSVIYRTMTFLEAGKDLRGLFSTQSDSLIGKALGYLHPLFLAAAIYLFHSTLGKNIQIIKVVSSLILFVSTYFIAHFEAKGELL